MLIFKGCGDNLSFGSQHGRQEQAAADSTPEELGNTCQIRRPPRHRSGPVCFDLQSQLGGRQMATRSCQAGWRGTSHLAHALHGLSDSPVARFLARSRRPNRRQLRYAHDVVDEIKARILAFCSDLRNLGMPVHPKKVGVTVFCDRDERSPPLPHWWYLSAADARLTQGPFVGIHEWTKPIHGKMPSPRCHLRQRAR